MRRKALYTIRHDAVLPYLSLIARDWADTSEQWPAMMAIRRIGSPRSEELFSTLTARDDEVGRAARMVAEERLDEANMGGAWEPS
jgi:hypothetical protein